MSEQLPLPLPVRSAFGREDFFVSEANERAVTLLEDWRSWPGGKLLLSGPAASGKSHLARIWAVENGLPLVRAEALAGEDLEALAESGAAVEDLPGAGAAAERALFHLFNMTVHSGRPLLVTGRGSAAGWGIGLRDLATRLSTVLEARLGPPDDALLHAVLLKLFSDRQLSVAPRVVRQILLRGPRDFSGLSALVERLDAAALAERARIGPRLVSRVLDSLPRNGEDGPHEG